MESPKSYQPSPIASNPQSLMKGLAHYSTLVWYSQRKAEVKERFNKARQAYRDVSVEYNTVCRDYNATWEQLIGGLNALVERSDYFEEQKEINEGLARSGYGTSSASRDGSISNLI